jgi:ubiquinone biosynthesis protein UbiJ
MNRIEALIDEVLKLSEIVEKLAERVEKLDHQLNPPKEPIYLSDVFT